MLTRYWVEFDFLNYSFAFGLGLSLGCGITAYNRQDAINLLIDRVFHGKELPEITKFIEEVDISKLDHGHIIPNMKPPIYRGIWYPLGYD